LNRREFLILMGWILAGAQIPFKARAASAEERILIIGAGMSGLAAAQTLVKKGYEVVVLEGRNRLGGRIWTSQNWKDTPLDLGASWIHGVKDNPLTALAAQIQAKTVQTSYDRYSIYTSDGKALNQSQEAHLESLWHKIQSAIQQANQQNKDQSLQSAVYKGVKYQSLSRQDQQWVDFLISARIEQEYAGSSKLLSAQWYESEAEFDGPDALFSQGYQILIQALAKGIQYTLNQEVKSIDWSEDEIVVKTQNKTYLADRVLVTVPLGVLKAGKIQFSPALPQEKTKAIQALGMGILNKLYLRFPRAFWPEQSDWIEKIPQGQAAWTEWLSLKRTFQLPILLGFSSGEKAKSMEKWSDQEIVSSAMQTLQTIFGKNIPKPSDYQITRWGEDPFSYGSYSFNALGALPPMRENLAKNIEEILFFAGEATERYHFSTVHGAYLSGLRAAQEISNASNP